VITLVKKVYIHVLSILVVIVLIVIIFYVIVSNETVDKQTGSSQVPVSDTITITKNGLELKMELSDTTLSPGDELKVMASITNQTGKDLSYYGYCGIPITITASKNDQSVWLISNKEGEACPDIYDPSAVKPYKQNDTLHTEIIFYPKVMLDDNKKIDAFSGEYTLQLFFRTEEGNEISANVPIKVVDANPEIISMNEAVEKSKSHHTVQEWMTENENIGIVEEKHFLSQNMWVIMFHTKDFQMDEMNPSGKRIIVHVDAKSGEILNVIKE
jgi:hypothetical protein